MGRPFFKVWLVVVVGVQLVELLFRCAFPLAFLLCAVVVAVTLKARAELLRGKVTSTTKTFP